KVKSKLVNYVKISVVNFGPVISKEDLPLIFEQFYQLPYKQKNLGSGIGLSLTKRLVELHRSKIIVNSSETKGTRFSILLKLGNEHLEKNECIEESDIFERYEENFQYVDVGEAQIDLQQEIGIGAASSSDTHLVESRQNLLIVEDNIDLQKFIQEIFKDKYRVFTAENGEEAITIAHQEAIDLIVSDVQMPIMDGFELCRYIKTTLICSH